MRGWLAFLPAALASCTLLYGPADECAARDDAIVSYSLDYHGLSPRGEYANVIDVLHNLGEEGPGRCGGARWFDQGQLIELGHHEGFAQESVSVSLWALFPDNADLESERLGVISKDQSNNNPGDFVLRAVYESGSSAPFLTARLQSDRESMYVCTSSTVPPDTWTHVVVEIGGPDSLAMWVDGVRSNGRQAIEYRTDTLPCQPEPPDGFTVSGLRDNTNNLVLGAFNSSSSGEGGPFTGYLEDGALDEVQIYAGPSGYD